MKVTATYIVRESYQNRKVYLVQNGKYFIEREDGIHELSIKDFLNLAEIIVTE
jgi:hypothetical protein